MKAGSKSGRDIGEAGVGNSSVVKRAAVWTGAFVLAAGWSGFVWAEQAGDAQLADRGGPVYQRHAFASSPMRGGWHGAEQSQFMPPAAPQINAGSFQRPYPYHLDYYRMRYGGSYAPYFGNLYGPPQVVTAPPYYGPYYGGYGYGQQAGYGFQGDAFQGAYGAAPNGCPCAPTLSSNGSGAATASDAGSQSAANTNSTNSTNPAQ